VYDGQGKYGVCLFRRKSDIVKKRFQLKSHKAKIFSSRIGASILMSLVCLTTAVGCANSGHPSNNTNQVSHSTNTTDGNNMKQINQKPVPMKLTRHGQDVTIDMTTEETDVPIANGVTYHAWTFDGTVPGPVLYLQQGDHVTLNLTNLDPQMAHNIDLHALQAAPNITGVTVLPKQTKTIQFDVTTPGVYMYHCAMEPMILHIGNGMYGAVIVTPKDGSKPTYTIVQSEFYKNGDYHTMLNGSPDYVAFNGKAFQYMTTPLHAKVGAPITIALVNAGPNNDSSFHIVGSIFNDVEASGNPANHEYNVQTYEVSPGNAALFKVTFKQAGTYPFLTHSMRDGEKGAEGQIIVSP
jgi:nitrite reductase (NO-forming)